MNLQKFKNVKKKWQYLRLELISQLRLFHDKVFEHYDIFLQNYKRRQFSPSLDIFHQPVIIFWSKFWRPCEPIRCVFVII